MYELVLRAAAVRHRQHLEDRIHTDFAEIGALAALTGSDPVFPSVHSIGTRVTRLADLAAVEAELAQHTHSLEPVSTLTAAESLLASVIPRILPDPHRVAMICTGEFLAGTSWNNVLRFVGRHRLPILLIVPGQFTSRRHASADLRTIYTKFGVPVMTVDAHDPIAAFRVATEAAHNARVGRGATILEAAMVETATLALNSRPPLEQMEDYMRRKGSWDDQWRAQVELAARRELAEIEERSA